MAEEVCMTGTRQMFYARLPEVKGTAGGGRIPARRGDAGESRLSLDAQSHDERGRSDGVVPDWDDERRNARMNAVRTGEDDPQQERWRRPDHLRRDLRGRGGLPARASQLAHCRTKQFVACSASLRIGSPTGWRSIPPARSSSRSAARFPAAALATVTSSAASNMAPCLVWKYPPRANSPSRIDPRA